jgi:hypothetical protein
VYVTLIIDAELHMKLICERTTFIPGFCVFLLHYKGFRRVNYTRQARLHSVAHRYAKWLSVMVEGRQAVQCQDVIGALNAPDRDPEIDLADKSLGRFAVLSWPFNPPVDRLAARA